RRQAVVRDALHVIAGVDDDRSGRSVEPHPFPAPMIPHLQALGRTCGQDGEQVDVLMTEEPAGTGAILFSGQRRIVIPAKPEIGAGELAVVNVWIHAEPHEDGLRDRLEQRLVSQDEAAEEWLIFRAGPVILGPEWRFAILRDVEGSPAPDPAFDKVR